MHRKRKSTTKPRRRECHCYTYHWIRFVGVAIVWDEGVRRNQELASWSKTKAWVELWWWIKQMGQWQPKLVIEILVTGVVVVTALVVDDDMNDNGACWLLVLGEA